MKKNEKTKKRKNEKKKKRKKEKKRKKKKKMTHGARVDTYALTCAEQTLRLRRRDAGEQVLERGL
jgi:hypothetical protein